MVSEVSGIGCLVGVNGFKIFNCTHPNFLCKIFPRTLASGDFLYYICNVSVRTMTNIITMKTRTSLAFDAMSGTAGEVTARSTRFGTILSGRARQSGRVTPQQTDMRALFARVGRSYKSLTADQAQSYYWTSSLYTSVDCGYTLRWQVNDGKPTVDYNMSRFLGCTIRPVCP